MRLAFHRPMRVRLDAGMPVSADREELFELRVERRRRELVEALEMLYGRDTALPLADRLVDLAHTAYLERPHDLHVLDLKRSLQPDWLQLPQMVGYAAYTERFAENLKGVEEKIPYLRELGVSYLHLMPLLEPRSGDNDGGYAVRDYRAVRSDLGTVEDLRHLATTLRENGVSLVLDLVLNHVAREHDWAVRARAGEKHYQDYFHLYPDRTQPDAYERTLPEVFPDFAPGNFSWDEDLQQWVWTTFNAWQWDLDWSNPDVLVEFAELILFLANLGVEVLRLDAIAFLWKRMGTTCQNEPEVHAVTQVLQAPSPGSPARRSRSRPRPSSRRTTSSSTSEPGATTARSATSRTTTPSWCRSGRCWPPRTPGSPCIRSSACRARRRARPGSPTSDATTTSGGPSPTRTRPAWA